MKIIQNKFAGEEISNKIVDLYNKQKQSQFPELLYFTYYNRLVLDIPATNASNSFRALYNPLTQVLSLHYYVSPYAHLDYSGLKQLYKYIDKNIVGSASLLEEGGLRGKVCLKRNVKAASRRVDRTKQIILTHEIMHATVCYKIC